MGVNSFCWLASARVCGSVRVGGRVMSKKGFLTAMGQGETGPIPPGTPPSKKISDDGTGRYTGRQWPGNPD
jgi:hypothetical protein